ncbi:hypothetical protein L1049_021981 [Liquidambar formosana]|uniref:Uncharacterized protein n=1 Tax=Liquidambar formosana TaxID=63359 RepID=A0AAP0RCZ3_LIQFO
MDVASSTDSKHLDLVKEDRSESTADGSKPSRLGIGGSLTAPTSSNMVGLDKEQNVIGLDIGQSTPGKKMQTVGGNNELSAAIPRRNDHSAPKQIFNGDIELGESCPFMRSTASVREWVNTKAALTGSLKKKNKEK